MDKRYNSTEQEALVRMQWLDNKTYDLAYNPGPLYTIDTPPPTVSGSLHIGHIFSYTQADIIARYKRMQGYQVFYPFGFDDNGLPTERYVEKVQKVQAHRMSRQEFIKLCLEQTKIAREEFMSLWQRMGLSVNWDYWYSTISKSTRKISQESFIRLYNDKYVYRRAEPALFCSACRTSVAQAELDSKELPSKFNDIVFKSREGNDLLIGTTRPELLPSCVALMFHPDDKRYQTLKETEAQVPLFDYWVPILADEQVEPEKGTGLVMVCTFGDKTDIEWYKKHNLPYKQSIGFDGKFMQDIPLLAGLKVHDAREKIIQELKDKRLLVGQKDITHPVNVHERCKKEIEYLQLTQWFVDVLSYKKEFLGELDKIAWHPSYMRSRIQDWIENLSWDWCISRQRYYGIPFPCWHCLSCGYVIMASIDQLPIDPQETPYKGKCPECDSADIQPDTDVMDTWNTSSLTPYITFSLYQQSDDNLFDHTIVKDYLPMSLRPQAHDILRTWAFDTIVKSWMHNKQIPWHDTMISGHVLSDKKEKLSKSQQNAKMQPEFLLEHYSADAIRYWTASARLGQDVAFSESQIKIGQKLVTKLWNAFRFAHGHLEDFTYKKELPDELGIVNKWLIDKCMQACSGYEEYLNKLEFGLALDGVESFFWQDFCDNYLELIKHQLFNPSEYSENELYATKWTLYTVGFKILQLYAPYVPFVTEAIYEAVYKKQIGVDSLHQTKFNLVACNESFEKARVQMDYIISIIAAVRKLKSEMQLSLKVPITELVVHGTKNERAIIEDSKKLIQGVSQAEEIKFEEGSHEPELYQEGEAWYAKV